MTLVMMMKLMIMRMAITKPTGLNLDLMGEIKEGSPANISPECNTSQNMDVLFR